ncbi:hypothetical protein SEA_SCHOMBER_10 [Gordonia Phage Schomber]|nr:hypothetical protein SEA_SCHOMBER_10 [Gordonia Phage Schomber]
MGGIINMEFSNMGGDLFAHGKVQAHMEGEGTCIACGTVFSGDHTCTFDEHIMHTTEHWHKKGDGVMENKEQPQEFKDEKGDLWRLEDGEWQPVTESKEKTGE